MTIRRFFGEEDAKIINDSVPCQGGYSHGFGLSQDPMGRQQSSGDQRFGMKIPRQIRAVSRGVSLVELIVVLTILSVLLALLLPAVQSARERAREAVCKNNLYQLNLALTHYSETHKKIPAAPRDGWVSGWCWEVLPYIEQQSLYNSAQTPLTIAAAPIPFDHHLVCFDVREELRYNLLRTKSGGRHIT